MSRAWSMDVGLVRRISGGGYTGCWLVSKVTYQSPSGSGTPFPARRARNGHEHWVAWRAGGAASAAPQGAHTSFPWIGRVWWVSLLAPFPLPVSNLCRVARIVTIGTTKRIIIPH